MTFHSPTKSPIHFIDTHAHLSSEQVYPHIHEVLARAKEKGIEKVVNICTDETTLHKGINLSRTYPWVYNAAATTPHDVDREGESFFPLVEQAAREAKLVAIGETGLDYHYERSPRKVQQEYLLRYFALALLSKLPLVFHCREAFEDLFALADLHYPSAPAVLHCFTGTKGEAKSVLERGWFLSLSGIVTFKKSEELREVAKYVPLDRLFLETDTPYLAPQSQRGKRNEPSWMVETAIAVAEIKGVTLDALAERSRENALNFFSFSKVP